MTKTANNFFWMGDFLPVNLMLVGESSLWIYIWACQYISSRQRVAVTGLWVGATRPLLRGVQTLPSSHLPCFATVIVTRDGKFMEPHVDPPEKLCKKNCKIF